MRVCDVVFQRQDLLMGDLELKCPNCEEVFDGFNNLQQHLANKKRKKVSSQEEDHSFYACSSLKKIKLDESIISGNNKQHSLLANSTLLKISTNKELKNNIVAEIHDRDELNFVIETCETVEDSDIKSEVQWQAIEHNISTDNFKDISSDKCDAISSNCKGDNSNAHLDEIIEVSKNLGKSPANISGSSFYCFLCEVVCNNTEALQLHINSKEHLEKESDEQNSSSNEKGGSITCFVEADSCSNRQNISDFLVSKKFMVVQDRKMEKINSSETFVSKQHMLRRNPFYCQVCNIACTGEEPYSAHLKSKKHQKKVLQNPDVSNSSMDSQSNSDANKYDTSVQSMSQETLQFQNDLPVKNHNFVCKICNLECCGIDAYNQHIAGRKHLRKSGMQMLINSSGYNNCNEISPASNPNETNKTFLLEATYNDCSTAKLSQTSEYISKVPSANYFECEVCHITCSGFDNYELHLKGKNHMKKVSQSSVDQNTAMNCINTSSIYCDICDIMCSSYQPYIDHVLSKKHLKAKEKLQTQSGITSSESKHTIPQSMYSKNLENQKVVKSSDNFPFECKTCDMQFNGKIPYCMHLKSEKHKRKKTQERANRDSDEDDDDDDDESISSDSDKGSSIGGTEVCDINDLNVTIFHHDEKVDFIKIKPRNSTP